MLEAEAEVCILLWRINKIVLWTFGIWHDIVWLHTRACKYNLSAFALERVKCPYWDFILSDLGSVRSSKKPMCVTNYGLYLRTHLTSNRK